MTDREIAEARLNVIRMLLAALQTTDPNPADVKARLRKIGKAQELERIIEAAALSDTDKDILYRRFVRRQDYGTIADFVGYSERTVRRNVDGAMRAIAQIL